MELRYGNNSWDIWAIRIQAPKVVMIRLWRRFNDQTVMGRRHLISVDEDLRYDLLLGENQGPHSKTANPGFLDV